jgi:CubicO group peptidase (beta-lactamase class C family)
VILSRATGNNLRRYAQQALFDPLGISPPPWDTDEDDIPFGGRGLKLTMHDLLKIGLLMLAAGEWEGRQILSADYVAASTQPQFAANLPIDGSEKGYGYMWWIAPGRAANPRYFAAGYGEQLLLVEPELELVAAVTANHTRAPKHVREFWKDYVCAAVTGPIRR